MTRHDPLLQRPPGTHPDRAIFDARMCAVFNARQQQYRARQFQAEIKWLGIRSTPAYVGEPECNGVAERFIRTLK